VDLVKQPTATEPTPVPAPSPEATGGKGTALEHRFGAHVLGALLLHATVDGLGGALVPVRVRFQGSAPVDDLVVTAEGAGTTVTWCVASRMRPTVTATSTKTVTLVADYLAVLREGAAEVEAGTLLLGLVTLAGYGPAAELAALAEVARGEQLALRPTIATRSKPLQERLRYVDGLVAVAAERLGWRSEVPSERDWTWTLLRALRVVQRSFDTTGPAAVALTTAMLPLVDGDSERADALRAQLDGLAAEYAATGATVSEADVRRALVGRVRLGAAADLAAARAGLAAAETALRARTGRALCVGAVEHRVDRAAARDALLASVEDTGRTGGSLVVRGEPSVGKSALTLDVVDALREDGAAVAVVGARAPSDPGADYARMFAGFPVADIRLLVLDGAEVVQEGGRERVRALAAAAHAGGLGVVVVTRDDAARAVTTLITEVTGTAAAEHPVEPLPDDDVAALAQQFPLLARLTERRSRWLLRRLGLVDLLLRAGPDASLRDGTLSEADVFAVCWSGWVRRHGDSPPSGPSPDGRERALLDVARARLHDQPAQPSETGALPSLRSDGLLLPADPLRTGEDFPGDVVRDLALTKHLLIDGGADLAAAGAPRWSLRAARVACQGRLVHGGLAELRRQLEVFSILATTHGARWADLPWEALLHSGRASQLLDAAGELLIADDCARLNDLLHVVDQHVSAHAATDPILVEPLVAWLTTQGRSVPDHLIGSVDELVVTWLRGVRRDPTADADPLTRAIRQRVRAAVLARQPKAGDDALLQTLATLGSDLDADARVVLRRVASDRPAFLESVIEDWDAAWALAKADAPLLAELAAAYYIDQPSPHHRGSHTPGSSGVRDHIGPWQPRSSWRYGPFWPLFVTDRDAARDLVVAVVGHAARYRVDHLSQPALGVTADVLGLGRRTYAGDSHVYAWYRGTGVGPAVCTNALLACERAMDQMVAQGYALRDVARYVLHPAADLAILGLVVGFLVRHVGDVTDELDDFLAVPALWELEFARTSHAGLAARAAEDEAVNSSNLRGSFRDVALMLVFFHWRDGEYVERLGGVADRLRAAATPDGETEAPLLVRSWAAYLDRRNFDDSTGGLSWLEPDDSSSARAAEKANLARVGALADLYNRYTLALRPPFFLSPPELGAIPPDANALYVLESLPDIIGGGSLPAVGVSRLADDLRRARDLTERPPESDSGLDVSAMATAVAAAAVRTGADVPDDYWLWACELLLSAAVDPVRRPYEDEGSLHSSGADRSAASALPELLRWAMTGGKTDDEYVSVVVEALTACTTGLAHEVRRVTALSLRPLWDAPCAGAPCLHRRAWEAVEAGARDVAYTPWDAEGNRRHVSLTGDLVRALGSVPPDQFVLQRLGAALASVCHATARAACLTADAVPLLDALVAAYGRAAAQYARHHYKVRDEDHAVLGDAVIAATDAFPDLLERVVTATGGRSLPTAELLDGVLDAATYDTDQRARLHVVWPGLFAALLDGPTADVDQSRGRVVACLVPAPRLSMHDKDVEQTLEQALVGWPEALSLSGLVERWLPLAASHSEAVDRLVGLLFVSPRDQQVTLGLPWVRRLVEPGGTRGVLSRRVPAWLSELRDGGELTGDARRDFDVIVDALAARGIDRARALQQRDA
jgi:hypothetical protein